MRFFCILLVFNKLQDLFDFRPKWRSQTKHSSIEMDKPAEMLENLQNWCYQPYGLQF